MPDIPKTVRDRVAWLELHQLDEHGEGLTQWEADFVESLRDQLLRGCEMSPNQLRILEGIREERLS